MRYGNTLPVCVVKIAILLLSLSPIPTSIYCFMKSQIQIEALQNGFQKMYLKLNALKSNFRHAMRESFIITEMKGIIPNVLVLLAWAEATLIFPYSSLLPSAPWVRVAPNI